MIERNPEPFFKEDFFLKKEINNLKLNKNNLDENKIINKEILFRNNLENKNIWQDDDLIAFRRNIQEQLFQIEKPHLRTLPGTTESLARFATTEPQLNRGSLRYLLTSGLAVELITGVPRFHHDCDLVILDRDTTWWIQHGTDNVTPENYWAGMIFEDEYLEQTAWRAEIEVDGVKTEIRTVHPAIILVQKLSNAWGRPPRERDFADVDNLIKFWKGKVRDPQSWFPIIEAAICALPKSEQLRTRTRLIQAIDINDQPLKQPAAI